MWLIVRGTDCAFLSVIVCTALVVPSARIPNDRDAGNIVTGAIPVPVKATDWGLLEALSVTVSEAVRLPKAEGIKVTVMLQLSPAPRVCGLIGQLPLWA
jgi:hypothetical protein